jgi:hypothetical protein
MAVALIASWIIGLALAHLSWERFIRNVDRFFPPIKALHLPCYRFDVHRPLK